VASMVTFPTASGDGQGMLALPRAPWARTTALADLAAASSLAPVAGR
jgi:hypothetical protein